MAGLERAAWVCSLKCRLKGRSGSPRPPPSMFFLQSPAGLSYSSAPILPLQAPQPSLNEGGRSSPGGQLGTTGASRATGPGAGWTPVGGGGEEARLRRLEELRRGREGESGLWRSLAGQGEASNFSPTSQRNQLLLL